MRDLKPIIANNISELRKEAGFTQIELAEKLNYSDKAVSKWEHGDSTPDINVLCDIADIFGVTVDYLTKADHSREKEELELHIQRQNHFHRVVTLMSVVCVWFVATVVFVVLNVLIPHDIRTWMAFLYAVPVSLIVLLVFNTIWGNRKFNYHIISALMWSILICFYLTTLKYNLWLTFTTGIPAQLIIYLWSKLYKKQNKKS